MALIQARTVWELKFWKAPGERRDLYRVGRQAERIRNKGERVTWAWTATATYLLTRARCQLALAPLVKLPLPEPQHSISRGKATLE